MCTRLPFLSKMDPAILEQYKITPIVNVVKNFRDEEICDAKIYDEIDPINVTFNLIPKKYRRKIKKLYKSKPIYGWVALYLFRQAELGSVLNGSSKKNIYLRVFPLLSEIDDNFTSYLSIQRYGTKKYIYVVKVEKI